MTSGSYTVGGTSPDYADIEALQAAITGALTGVVEGKLRAGTYEAAEVLDANGQTVTASNYLKITYDTGAYHGFDLEGGVQFRGLQPNTTQSHVVTITADHTHIDGINFNRWHGTSNEGIRVDATGCYVEKCLFWGNGNINADGIFLGAGNHFTSTSTTDTLYVSNCFFGWLGRTGIHVQGDKAGTVYVYNCTAIHMDMGNQNSTDGNPRSYVGIGDDLGDGPTTNGINWQIKNTFVHTTPDGNGVRAPCFGKAAASSWLNCNNNASADTTAPGTSAQTSVAIGSQFEQGPTEITVGENTGDDYGGAWADTELQEANPNTNYGSDTIESIKGNASANVKLLIRADMTNVPSTTRVLGAQLAIQKGGSLAGNFTGSIRHLLRNWVESEATWNIYSTGNSWTTAGAAGSGDTDTYDVEGGAVGSEKRAIGFETSVVTGGGNIEQNEYFALSGGRMTEWVQAAIDGSSPAADPDHLDLLFMWFNGDVDGDAFYVSEHTDGNRPYWRIWHDTASAPLDIMPVAAGVLDGNGANLASDSDYPIGTTDLYGNTRDATWDIGAVGIAPPQTATGTLVTQAGVGYDGVLSSEAFLAGSAVLQDGVPYLGSIKGADFLPPVIDYFGDQWTGTYKDIDEEPASDVDFIASPAAPNPVALLDEGFESGTTGWSLPAEITRVNPGDAYEGSFVVRAVSTTGVNIVYDNPHPAWPVNPNALYRISFAARRTSGTTGQLYAQVRSRNSSQQEIFPWQQAVFQHSLTWLTAEAGPSDTSIQVADATHWKDGSGDAACAIFGAKPDMSDIEAAERPAVVNIQAGGISGNTVTLDGAIGGSITYPVGTWVRCHRHTGTFVYPISGVEPGTGWTTYSALFGGIRTLRDRFFDPLIERWDGDTFRMASVDFTIGFLLNYQATGSETMEVDAVLLERLDNSTLKRIAISQETGIDGRDHLRYRVRKDIAVGTVNVTVKLLQRDTSNQYLRWKFNEVESWQHNNVGATWTDYKQTITNDAGITNRKELYLWFEATSA